MKYPGEEAETVLSGPGITIQERKVLLHSMPDIPDSYLECVQRFKLHGVRSGYFAFWPEAFVAEDIVGSLVMAASDANPYRVVFNDVRAAQVASWEADPIVVALRESPLTEGTVLKFNSGSPREPGAALAQDFKTFMLLVGNLDKIAGHMDGTKAIDAFHKCFASLVPVAQYWSAWSKISQVVLLR